MTPQVYAYWLHAFRVEHWRFVCANPPIRDREDGTTWNGA